MYELSPSDFWRYMVLGGFLTGLRMGDLICATWGNFDFAANMLRIHTAKTDATVNVPISPRLKTEILALRKKAGRVKSADYLWPEQAATYLERGAGTFSNEFYDEVLFPAGLVAKRTKKKKKDGPGRGGARIATEVSFHCFRHTFVSISQLTGTAKQTVKEMVGHKSDAINDIYTHTPTTVLIEAVTKLDEALKNEPKAVK
jgi:integrase